MSEETSLQRKFMICVGNPIPINPADVNDKRMRLDALDGQSLIAELDACSHIGMVSLGMHFSVTNPDTYFGYIKEGFDGVYGLRVLNNKTRDKERRCLSLVPFKITKLHAHSF